MTTYLSPGVYVKEVSSGAAPIAGVGTSTAGFIGVIKTNAGTGATDKKESAVADQSSGQQSSVSASNVEADVVLAASAIPLMLNQEPLVGNSNSSKSNFEFDKPSDFGTDKEAYTFYAKAPNDDKPTPLTINSLDIEAEPATVKFEERVTKDHAILASYAPAGEKPASEETKDGAKTDDPPPAGSDEAGQADSVAIKDRYSLKKIDEPLGKGDGNKRDFPLSRIPFDKTFDKNSITVKAGTQIITDFDIVEQGRQAHLQINADKTAPAANTIITISYQPQSVKAGEVKLCTNFTEFKKYFGDFSKVDGQSHLAHAVYGFFRNGGTRCYVSWVKEEADISTLLDEDFAAIDEIAIVAAPGLKTKSQVETIIDHCEALGDRVAIIDSADNDTATNLEPGTNDTPRKSQYAAFYYPWIEVFDPATKGNKFVPPSGHIAGIYARVDSQRGVHKAPANEIVQGASGLKKALTRAKQDGLNPQGVNCIRNLNGAITVWGARTWGGDDNGEFKYINTRRLFNYIRESIDEGTQWAVFEPNSPELWAKVRRSVTAFLTLVWRSGALFGSTPDEAFSVQCDAETNPPEVRAAGQLVTKVGVAIVKPAEFVIFELSQKSSGGQ